MGFMKNIGKMALGFIPGGNIAGAALDAFGSSGGQGGSKFNSNSSMNQTTKENFNSTDNINQFNEAVEDPTTTAFRRLMQGGILSEMGEANKPIYGDAQKAKYLNELNDLAGGAIASLKGGLAAGGRLDSGAFDTGVSDIQTKRFGQASDFFSQLPFLESQERASRMNPLLQLGASFAGHAPISQRLTGTSTRTGESTRNTTGSSTNQGSQSMSGPGFLKGLANNLGGLVGAKQGYGSLGSGPRTYGDYDEFGNYNFNG